MNLGPQEIFKNILISASSNSDPDYFTIEGMRSQEFSIGIFIFMLMGVLVFMLIILNFIFSAKNEGGLKKGEKVLMTWIILGTISAVGFGAMQLLQGRLF